MGKHETKEYDCIECGWNCTNNGEPVIDISNFLCCNCRNIENKLANKPRIELCSLCNEGDDEDESENEMDYEDAYMIRGFL